MKQYTPQYNEYQKEILRKYSATGSAREAFRRWNSEHVLVAQLSSKEIYERSFLEQAAFIEETNQDLSSFFDEAEVLTKKYASDFVPPSDINMDNPTAEDIEKYRRAIARHVETKLHIEKGEKRDAFQH